MNKRIRSGSRGNRRNRKVSGIKAAAAIFAAVLLTAAAVFLGVCLYRRNSAPDRGGGFCLTVLELDKADCMLFESEDASILIDGGDYDDAGTVIGFLLARKVYDIDLIVATHPHSDHIGGLDEVLNEEMITVGAVLTPDIPPELIPDSVSAGNFYQALRDSGAARLGCEPGSVYEYGKTKVTVLAPVRNDYQDLNNWSAVVRIDCGGASALFTGDACAESERDMLADPFCAPLLDCDLLKVGHHGSSSSSTGEFLRAVSPKIAVITSRSDKSQFHLIEKTVSRLEKAGVEVYSTCEYGRITVKGGSNGFEVSGSTKKE